MHYNLPSIMLKTFGWLLHFISTIVVVGIPFPLATARPSSLKLFKGQRSKITSKTTYFRYRTVPKMVFFPLFFHFHQSAAEKCIDGWDLPTANVSHFFAVFFQTLNAMVTCILLRMHVTSVATPPENLATIVAQMSNYSRPNE